MTDRTARVKIRPAPGRRVRDPDRRLQVVQSAGQTVTWSPAWQRKLDAGDIEIVIEAGDCPQGDES